MALSQSSMRAEPRLKFSRRLDKIIELLVYLAEIKPRRDQYQAVKLLYLADKKHFNLYGRPITFEAYFALDYGPVASSALDMIKGDQVTLRKAGISRLPVEIIKRENIYTLVRAERPTNKEVFSRSDLKVFDEVVREYGEKTFDELFNITHDHIAYKSAWNSRKPSAKRAPMFYEDMLDEREDKEELVNELAEIAPYLR